MSNELQRRIEYAKNIKPHLVALSKLAGRPISAGELLDVETTQQLKKQIRTPASVQTATLPFSALRTEPFRKFVSTLVAAAPQPIQIWIDTSNVVGLLTLGSLLDFNFNFDFEDEPSGIIVLQTEDLLNRLIFDFSEEHEERTLELEWGGPSWSSAKYERR